jgi:hypothetical protein
MYFMPWSFSTSRKYISLIQGEELCDEAGQESRVKGYKLIKGVLGGLRSTSHNDSLSV